MVGVVKIALAVLGAVAAPSTDIRVLGVTLVAGDLEAAPQVVGIMEVDAAVGLARPSAGLCAPAGDSSGSTPTLALSISIDALAHHTPTNQDTMRAGL